MDGSAFLVQPFQISYFGSGILYYEVDLKEYGNLLQSREMLT